MSDLSRATMSLRHISIMLALAIASLIGNPARAQNAAPAPRSSAELEQLVAPVALYPDSLLSQVLMASTYPLEVVAAARWVQQNPNVNGKALEDAMQQQSWDASVKALTSVPQTLQMMNDKLDWTQQLGDAFLAQQSDVLNAVQGLRARADAAGHLQTTEQQKVTRTPRSSSGGQASVSSGQPPVVYAIESANPEVYYVPIYDPGAVYGAWPYPDNAPFYWTPPGYVASNVFSFAAGVFVGAAVWGHVDWRRNRVDIDVNRYNRFNRTNIANNTWTHDPAHRHGTPYRDSGVAQRFGNPSQAAAREAFRGQAEAGRRDLAKGGAREAGKQGQRPNAGKQGQRSNAAQQGQRREAKGNNAGRAKSGAGSRQAGQQRHAQHQRAGGQQAARHRTVSHQPAARRSAGTQARAQQVSRGGGGRGGGGGRHGGGGGGRRR